MSATDLVGIAVTTFILGSIYGLVAIGMTLIYGALRILDMSQGSMVMIGSFVGWGVLVVAGWSPIVAIVLAFAATFLLGTFTQLVSVQPLMKRRNAIDFEMITFITTFAVAIVFTNLALEIFGPQQRNVTFVIAGGINVYNGVNLPYQSLAMALVSVVLMAGLGLFLARTRWGMAIRAVAQDLDAARLMGVPVGKLYPLTMGLASALAGIAGVFLGGLYFASPNAGDQPLLIALIVVIFGGLGSLPGTVYAAYAIGFIQATAEVVVGTTWALPILYAVILLVLIVRPQGLMGKPSEARL
jgi:branched-subunit amino acid ABC-type transport system permease component